MTRALLLGFVVAMVVGASCAGPRLSEAACRDGCAVAARCGILPSTLGGAVGDDEDLLYDECVARCVSTDASTVDEPDSPGEVILDCLTPHVSADICDIGACEEVFDCLRTLPAAVVGAREVTFRLVDGEEWMQVFLPGVCAAMPTPTDPLELEEQQLLCGAEDDPCPMKGAATESVDRLPLCFQETCDDPHHCDPRLCDLDLSPSLDCAALGIDTVQFGYFDRHGGLHLDAWRYSCTQAAAGQVVTGVADVVIYPVAMFTGTLTPRVLSLLGAPDSAAGRPYCWLSHPSDPPLVGWLVRSGSNLIPVPTPGSAELAAELAADPTLFPRGCSCLLDQYGCEDDAVNMNCDNGLDDDQDGLIDAEDPGCK